MFVTYTSFPNIPWVFYSYFFTTMVIRTTGKKFNPGDVPKPDYNVPLEELQPRGAGLYLMNQLMDDIQFSFNDEEGNLLTLVKYR